MTTERHILIIDDSEIVLSQLKARLEEAGFSVVTTVQIVGAARFLRNADMVILDYHMPGMDGSEVLSSLRAACKDTLAPPAFYLYTTDANIVRDYRALGFDGVFSSKGNMEALVRQVQAASRLLKLRRR